jgi:outer membrane protein
LALEEQNKKNYLQFQDKLTLRKNYAKASFATMESKFRNGRVEAVVYSSVKNQFLTAEYDLLKNKLQLQYIDLKINLLKGNNLE